MNRVETIPSALLARLVRGRAAVDVLLVIDASVLIALSAQIALPLPFTPVPLTMQPLAVLLVGAALGASRGAAAATLYLLEGLGGLPVFAQGHGGAIWLVGPTAGYLYSYPAAAWLAGWFSQRGWGSTTVRAVSGMLAALAVIYAAGWSWLAIFTGARAAFVAGVKPFIVADIVKIALGAALLPYAQRLVSRSTAAD
jgi:biotin transport system substrate-specific component